ncbi:hypothetical protein KI387_029492, partial [Taxus chinensis]
NVSSHGVDGVYDDHCGLDSCGDHCFVVGNHGITGDGGSNDAQRENFAGKNIGCSPGRRLLSPIFHIQAVEPMAPVVKPKSSVVAMSKGDLGFKALDKGIYEGKSFLEVARSST